MTQKLCRQKARINMRIYGIRSGINNPTCWATRHAMSYGGGCMTLIVQVAVIIGIIVCIVG